MNLPGTPHRTSSRRRHVGSALAALAGAAGVLGIAGTAKATPENGALALEFTAPEACIDAATFRERLAALPASPGRTEPPRRVTIVITRHDDLFTGALRVEHANGSTTDRQVTSTRCDEVSDALAFVAAVALGLDYAPPPPRPLRRLLLRPFLRLPHHRRSALPSRSRSPR